MPLNPETGNVNADLLSANLNQAADIYIQRVDKCPCGDTAINLYRGSDSSKFQDMRTELQVFLKGSKKKKEELRIKKTEVFAHFTEVWQVRENHYHKDLPAAYIFLRTCCYKQGCPHLRCKEGCPSEELRWFPNGPSLMT